MTLTLCCNMLQVIAKEKGSEPRTSTATVIIHLEDMNDHHPHFSQRGYNIKVREDKRPGEVITRITVSTGLFVCDEFVFHIIE